MCVSDGASEHNVQGFLPTFCFYISSLMIFKHGQHFTCSTYFIIQCEYYRAITKYGRISQQMQKVTNHSAIIKCSSLHTSFLSIFGIVTRWSLPLVDIWLCPMKQQLLLSLAMKQMQLLLYTRNSNSCLSLLAREEHQSAPSSR